jgi:hypothetical protein
VDPDRWEFANEYFLRGRRDLLGEIHRRKPSGSERRRGGGAHDDERQSIIEVGQYGLHQEVEQLKRDKGVLMQEVIRLRQQQQDSSELLHDLQDRLELQEQRQQQMIGFLATALQHPGLVQHLVASTPVIKRIEDGRRRKKRKGAGDSSDSDGGADTPDGGPASQALAVAQPQQSLADLAQAFMQLLNTRDSQPKSRGSRRRDASAGRRTTGPIIEEAPASGSHFAVPAAMPAIPLPGGGVQAGGGPAPMVIGSTPVGGYAQQQAALPLSFEGIAPPSAAAAAAFNAAGAGAGLSDFVPMGDAGQAGAPLVPVPLPGGGPLTDNNPIVELPELDSLGLGNVDLVSMMRSGSGGACVAAAAGKSLWGLRCVAAGFALRVLPT